MREQTEA
jgi:hypothetical protein